MRISFPHSHAFRRGRVIVDAEGEGGTDCLIEFGDGGTVVGSWRRREDVIELDIPAYRTARRTPIVARRWALRQGPDGSWRSDLIA